MNTTHTSIRLISVFLVLLFALTAILPVLAAKAPATITSTVNLINVNKNETGEGWYWANRTGTLYLRGINLDTADQYGFKLPKNATVVLEGNNTIKASKAALVAPGAVVIKGKGTLNLTANEIGLWNYSSDDTHKLRIAGGTFNITAGIDAIRSDVAELSFTDAVLNLTTVGTEGSAIAGRVIRLANCTVNANNSIDATGNVHFLNADVTVISARSAVTYGNKLFFRDVKMSAGAAEGSLADITEYSGENCLVTKANASTLGTSMFFGDSVPRFVDYLILIAVLAGVVAIIAVPAYRKHRKVLRLRAERDAMLQKKAEDEKAARAAAKAAARKESKEKGKESAE